MRHRYILVAAVMCSYGCTPSTTPATKSDVAEVRNEYGEVQKKHESIQKDLDELKTWKEGDASLAIRETREDVNELFSTHNRLAQRMRVAEMTQDVFGGHANALTGRIEKIEDTRTTEADVRNLIRDYDEPAKHLLTKEDLRKALEKGGEVEKRFVSRVDFEERLKKCAPVGKYATKAELEAQRKAIADIERKGSIVALSSGAANRRAGELERKTESLAGRVAGQEAATDDLDRRLERLRKETRSLLPRFSCYPPRRDGADWVVVVFDNYYEKADPGKFTPENQGGPKRYRWNITAGRLEALVVVGWDHRFDAPQMSYKEVFLDTRKEQIFTPGYLHDRYLPCINVPGFPLPPPAPLPSSGGMDRTFRSKN